MVREVSAGGIVYSRDGGHPRILFILDTYGQWTLPKGHVDPGESLQQAALREIEEEVGLKGVIEQDLGATRYQFTHASRVIDKVVHYYLVRATSTALRLAPAEVLEAKWVPLERAVEVSSYANNNSFLEKAVAILRAQAT